MMRGMVLACRLQKSEKVDGVGCIDRSVRSRYKHRESVGMNAMKHF